MADFLTRMTQRTLGLLPVIQPVIASKYGSESTRAYMPGGLAPGDPDQAMEESLEDWEGMVERMPAAPVSQFAVPPEVRTPAEPVPGMPPSAALPQEQPSTPKAQQTKPVPVRPQAVQPLRETTDGDLPSPLVPQPQDRPVPESGREIPQAAELPGRGQAKGGKPVPQPYMNPNPDPIRGWAGLAPALGIEALAAPTNKNLPFIASGSSGVVSAQPRISDSQENQPFSSTPTVSNVPATKPRRGQGKPSSRSDVGTRFITSRTSEHLVAAPTGELPQIDQKPGGGTRFIASGTGEHLVAAPTGELPQIDQKPGANAQAASHKSSVGVEEQHVSPLREESSPRGSIQAASHNEVSSIAEYPYVSNLNAVSPTLLSSSSPISVNTGGNPLVSRRTVAHARRISTGTQTESVSLPGQGEEPLIPNTKYDSDPFRVEAQVYSPWLVPALVPILSQTVSPALAAEADLVEPGFPPLYPPVQNRHTGTTAVGKGAIAQQAESHDAPTIRVTIGRIDVRAVPPTPPASPAPAKSNRSRPALSLSDYLKQRKGGQP